MAIIALDDNTYLQSALQYAKQGLITPALALLGKCQTYEGQLNSIVLLFLRGDNAVANNQLASLLAFYGARYNCIPDLVAILSRYNISAVENIAFNSSHKHAKSKHSIDAQDIVEISDDEFDSVSEIFEEEIDFYELAEALSAHRMYDIHSVEYLHYIKYKAYLMYAEGKQEEANKLIEQILDTSTDDVEMLMWKVSVFNNIREYDKAMKIAETIYDKVDDVVHLGYIAESLREGCGNKEMLRYVIVKILDNVDQCRWNVVDNAMRICNDYIVDYQLASKFALFVMQQYQYFPLDSLRDSVWIFVNCGQLDNAKNVVTLLLQSAPEDVWAQTLLSALPMLHNDAVKAYASPMPPVSVRGVALPRSIVHHIVEHLSTVEQLDNVTISLLRGISAHCKVLSRQSELTSSLIEGILYYIQHVVLTQGNISMWSRYVADGLLLSLYPMDIMVAGMMRLVQMGHCTQYTVNLGAKLYKLDTWIMCQNADNSFLIETLCILSLIASMSEKRACDYIAHFDKDEHDESAYLTAVVLAEMCKVKPNKDAFDELIELYKYVTNAKKTATE